MVFKRLSEAERKMRAKTEVIIKLEEKAGEAGRAREAGNFYRSWVLYEEMFDEIIQWLERDR